MPAALAPSLRDPLVVTPSRAALCLTDGERRVSAVRDVNRATGRLNSGIPQVPGPRGAGELSRAGQQLPIWPLKDDILRTIGHNQVTLLVGDTGSGKTTQVSAQRRPAPGRTAAVAVMVASAAVREGGGKAVVAVVV